jgi:hypothetical protein
MKKLLLTGIAVLFLATGTAHAQPLWTEYETVYYVCDPKQRIGVEPLAHTAYVNIENYGEHISIHLRGGDETREFPITGTLDYYPALIFPAGVFKYPSLVTGHNVMMKFGSTKYECWPKAPEFQPWE